MEGTNKRLDGVIRDLIRDVQELKTSLEFTQNKFYETNTGCKELGSKIELIEQYIGNSKQEMEGMFSKLDYIGNQCRRTFELMGLWMKKERTGINQRLKF